jgi:sulfur-oxidizing protein SoxX
MLIYSAGTQNGACHSWQDGYSTFVSHGGREDDLAFALVRAHVVPVRILIAVASFNRKQAGGAMRKTVHIVITGAATVLLGLGVLLNAPAVQAGGQAPDAKTCNDKDNPPKDAVTQGGCVVIDRAKGNCMACHQIAGTTSGDIATKFENMAQRWPDKVKLREHIWDSSKANPNTVMPPFGRHQILTPDEIDKVVEFVLSL